MTGETTHSKCQLALLIALLLPLLAQSTPFSPANSNTPSILNGNYTSLLNALPHKPTSPLTAGSLETQCNGDLFGVNPVLSDCQSARDHISPDYVQHPWASRHTGLPSNVFPLPYRIMGSGDNNLAVVLGTYAPNVQCLGSFGPEWASCRDILADMPADTKEYVFGPRDAPGVEQPLPTRVDSSDDKCLAQIFSTGALDTSNWYRMWEAMTAIFSICIRARRGGVYRGL
ncbi:MAG: hypothetical protein Q9168_007764, partial [Polycauliona sp. 1 TL-2023]